MALRLAPMSEAVRAYATMNTVRALECLAVAPLSAPELAASLQVSARTARRLLQRLAVEGFVTQERGHRRRYHATLRLADLGRQVQRGYIAGTLGVTGDSA
jgi:DNA-binding IclR family transcriptional regulator